MKPSPAVQAILDRSSTLDDYIAALQAIRNEHGNLLVTSIAHNWPAIDKARRPMLEHVAEPHGRQRNVEYFNPGMDPAKQTKGQLVVRV